MTATKTSSGSRPAHAIAAGYAYQYEVILYYISSNANLTHFCVEGDDDFVMKNEQNELDDILGQAKHSIVNNNYCFTDSSIDLWKTLANWASAIKNGKYDVTKTKFHCISNKPVKKGSFIEKILDPKTNKTAIYEELVTYGSKSRNKEIKKFLDFIQSCDKNKNIELFDKIVLVNVPTDSNTLKNSVRKHLRVPDEIPFQYIYDSLVGWTMNTLTNLWRSKKYGIIQKTVFDKYLANIIHLNFDRPFYERAHALLIINDRDRARVKKNKFVEQLEAIHLSEDGILREIDHFLRAKWEKTEFAQTGEVPEREFEEFYKNLSNRWLDIFETSIRLEGDRYSQGPQMGYFIFTKTVHEYKASLFGFQTSEDYTTRGAYHLLANHLRVGWHPDWKKQFLKK